MGNKCASLTYSAESEGLALDLNGQGCEPSPSVKLTHTAAPSSKNTGPTSPAMTTFELLPLPASEQMELPLTPSAAGSRAKTLACRAKALGLKVSKAAYGESTPVLLAKFDRAMSLWKTSQLCLEGGLAEFSETWPRSGMMRNGIAYQLLPLAPLTSEIECGLLPTITINGNYNRIGASKTSGDGLVTALKKLLPTICARDSRGEGDASKDNSHEKGISAGIGFAELSSEPRAAIKRGDQPLLGRKVHGVPCWLDRISALGNAVVPQIPQIIGEAIMEIENARTSSLAAELRSNGK